MYNIMPVIIDRNRTNDGKYGFEGFFDELIKQYHSNDAINAEIKRFKSQFTVFGKAGIKKDMSVYRDADVETHVDEIIDSIEANVPDEDARKDVLFRLIWSSFLAHTHINKDELPGIIVVKLLERVNQKGWLKSDLTNVEFFVITQDPNVYESLESYNEQLKSAFGDNAKTITDDNVYDRFYFVKDNIKPSKSELQDDIKCFINNFFKTPSV